MKEIQLNVKEIDPEALRILGRQGEVSNWQDEYFIRIAARQNENNFVLPCGCEFGYNPGNRRQNSSISLLSACGKHLRLSTVGKTEEIAIGKDKGNLIFAILGKKQTLTVAPAHQMGV